MKYNILIMLLSVLCLFGCSSSESEPQSVAFSIKEYNVDQYGEEFQLEVTANCKWTITATGDGLSIITKTGEGNSYAKAFVSRNNGYDMRLSFITVTSEDGSSSSIVQINQEAKIGLQAGNVDTLSAEGGSFTIPIKTNDEIISIETPDWITYTSARALTESIYSFTANSNDTRSVREGTITIQGKELSQAIEVIQDSHAPQSVELTQNYLWTTNRDIRIPFSVIPEYADLSKLDTKSNSNVKTISLEDGYATVTFYDYGTFEVYFYNEGKQIGKASGEYIPLDPLETPDGKELYVGQKYYLDYWHYTPDYILASSNTNAVEVLDNRNVLAKDLGESQLTVTHPNTESRSEITVKVEPFLLEARIGNVTEQQDGTFNVTFAARIEGPQGMSCSGFVVTDKEGYIKILNEGNVKDMDFFAKKIYTSTINVSRNGYNNILEALRGYHFMVEVVISEKVYQRTVAIDTFNVGSY